MAATLQTDIRRHALGRVEQALTDTRIVTLEGPRQSGKTTLCWAISRAYGMASATLDDVTTRAVALTDPVGFLAELGSPAFIDELQRAPDLVLALKVAVDRDPAPGRFLVTGSANLLLSPAVGDSLAGRVERVPLRPFTQSELADAPVPAWLDRIWRGGKPPYLEGRAIGRSAHASRIEVGGFPAVIARAPARRRAWLDDYISALVTRDVPDLAGVRRPDSFGPLLRYLAAVSGTTTRLRPIAESLAVDEKTVRSYVRLLALLHLVVEVPAWTPGVGPRAVRSPRLFIEDSGLMMALLGADAERVAHDDTVTGRAYETFVAMEIARLLPFTEVAPRMHHWRVQDGSEVDLVLEDRRGRVVGIEIKAAASVGRSDLRGLVKLRSLVPPERFVGGLVLCTAPATVPLGDRMWAVPIDALWTATDPDG